MKMLFIDELKCPQCRCGFESASELLKHFATHAIEELAINSNERTSEQKSKFTKKAIPGLHPIIKRTDNCSGENVNPLQICEVTINDRNLKGIANEGAKFEVEKIVSNYKKYECLYCKRSFGWPTDLKRHLLSHTGEKPFKCNFCRSSYTRKIILHKHIIKYHKNMKIPDLKPINTLFTVKFEEELDKSI